MKLIIGGAFQGKLTFAKQHFSLPDGWVDGADCTTADLLRCRGINHFHEYIGRLVGEQADVWAIVQRLLDENPDIIVVTNEIGYGVVPISPYERQYRETTGRVCTRLAAAADEVYRVVCGIGQVLKGA